MWQPDYPHKLQAQARPDKPTRAGRAVWVPGKRMAEGVSASSGSQPPG